MNLILGKKFSSFQGVPMRKSTINGAPKVIDLGEDWSSHPVIEWLISNKKILLVSFLALFIGLIFTYQILAVRTLNAENDFFIAQRVFTQFQQANTSPDDSTASSDLSELKTILQRHPELKPRYEGALAQTLLTKKQTAEARIFIEDIFKRTESNHLQLYQDYSQTSLLINEGQFTDALQRALQLQTILDKSEESVHPILYVFNLIRLAMLYQQTDQPKKELLAWDQLFNQPNHLDAVLAANQVLKIGQVSLTEYMEERKKALTP
jgi:hypothetical protein